MIRPTTPEDVQAIVAITVSIGFQPAELDQLSDMLTDYFDNPSEQFWLTDDDDVPVGIGPAGIAYCAPEPMTAGTWNLRLIAIHPDLQGQGRGSMLMNQVEQTVIARGGRMLLVETSGLPEFERTRLFYAKCSYEEEGRIRDFYEAGDDKVVFRKVLA